MAGRLRAAVDGGSRGNPGPAAWAVAILGDDGAYVEGHAGGIGRATNNVAEYRALLEALRIAEERGADDVEVLADSELIVRQVEGRYRVRHPGLISLHAEAMRRIRALPAFRIRHVPREANRDADRLVNRVLDLCERGAGEEELHLVELPEAPATAGS